MLQRLEARKVWRRLPLLPSANGMVIGCSTVHPSRSRMRRVDGKSCYIVSAGTPA
jgi:hypothetical protein